MRRLVFIIVLVGLSSIYWYSTQKDPESVPQKLSRQMKKVLKIQSETSIDSNPYGTNSSSDEAATSNLNVETADQVDLGVLNEIQLKNWILLASEDMDSTEHETIEVDTKLRAQAKTLKSEQLPVIIKSALETKAPANSRILSGYILSLTQNIESVDAMKQLAEQPLPDLGPILPHSESELRRSHELAIRFMQVDELAERAKTDTNARDKLILLSQSAGAEEVRNYAARKLKTMK